MVCTGIRNPWQLPATRPFYPTQPHLYAAFGSLIFQSAASASGSSGTKRARPLQPTARPKQQCLQSFFPSAAMGLSQPAAGSGARLLGRASQKKVCYSCAPSCRKAGVPLVHCANPFGDCERSACWDCVGVGHWRRRSSVLVGAGLAILETR
jgi:hypothetical protein